MTDQQRQLLRSEHGVVHHTETFGTVDGPGIRFVLFLQGCPLRCLYCHNPDSIPVKGGYSVNAGVMTEQILRYRNFIKSGGVTFSGGEPLMQPVFVSAVEQLLLEQGITSAIDTAGMLLTKDVRQAVDYAELILLDIKAYDSEMAYKLTGRDNKLSFDMLDYCEKNGIAVWVRHVLLRGYTLDERQLKALAEKLTEYKCIQRIELLPFHKLGEPKWEETCFDYKLKDVSATTKDETEWAKQIFLEQGHEVQ